MNRWSMLAVAATLTVAGVPEARGATYAYIADLGGSTVYRMDLATNEAVPIPVEQSPLGIGASLDGSRVVVSNEISASASIIDGVTASVLATVPLGTSPRGVGVTLDGAKAYVASWLEGISVLDLAAGTVVATLPVDGTPEAVIVSPSGHRAYVTKTLFDGTGTLLVIDTATDLVVADVVVASSPARGLTVDPDGTRVYVGLDDGIVVIDTATNLPIGGTTVGCDALCPMLVDLAITPDGATVYASVLDGDGILAFDAATLAVTTIPTSAAVASSFGVEVSPDGATLYVLNSGDGTIDLIDTATHTVRATLVALAALPVALGDFIVGPTPLAEPPLLGTAEQSCQKALLDSFKAFGAKAHQLLSGCLMRLVKDRAAGAVKSTTVSACTRDLGPANPASRLAKARALARSRVLARCASLAPDALGLPCSASATSVEQAVDCVLDRQHAQVARLVADEVAAPCALLAGVGAGAALPGVCE